MTEQDLLHVRATECQCIQLWRPLYNHPWILRLQPTSTTRKPPKLQLTTAFSSTGSRLWQKVRRRLKTLCVLQYFSRSSTSPEFGWECLMTLAQGGQASFDMARRLRSSEFSQLHFFAMYRMANYLDDPPRTLVRSLVRQALEFRGAALPRSPRPLVLPLLAHPEFTRNVRKHLQALIAKNKEFLVPLHLPNPTCIAGKHADLRKLIYNHRPALRTWTWHEPPQCPCHQLLERHTELRRVNGHIASPARLLAVSSRLRHILILLLAKCILP